MSFFSKTIEELKKNGNFREIKKIEKLEGKYIWLDGEKYLDLSSSNYLGLRDDERVKNELKEAIDKYGVGSGASRLVCGTADVYNKLEEKIASLKKQEKAVFFNSGYDANLGTVSAIMNEKDVIFCDKLNHASLYDGIKLSNAKLIRYKHNDLDDLENKLKKYRLEYDKAMILTDTVFSMDGDKAKLKELIELKKKYNALLMIDEAHAGGVLGESGGGLAEELNVLPEIDINMGTFSKAYGGQGGYIAGKSEIIDYIVNKARSLIYTTSLPPAIVAGNLKALEISEIETWRREKLNKIKNYAIEKLKKLGYNIEHTETQIIPIILENNEHALKLSTKLIENGIYAVAIRKPTVIKPRIRLSLGTLLDFEDIDRFIEVIER